MSDVSLSESRPWEMLEELVTAKDVDGVRAVLEPLSPDDLAYMFARIKRNAAHDLLGLLSPYESAELLAELSNVQAVQLLHNLSPTVAAAVVDELDDSNREAHLLVDLEPEEAEAILDAMPADHAADVRELMAYSSDVAGGIMMTELVSYRHTHKVGEVLDDLHANREKYGDYNVQYLYVLDEHDRLRGVLRMRDLLFAKRDKPLTEVMIGEPLSVHVQTSLDELREFFKEHAFLGVPVVDDAGELLGVLRRAAVEAAVQERTNRNFLRIAGILGGEELRSMPLRSRSGRRLSWLSINIVLNIIAAQVIATYEDTLAAVISLAIFLPMISDMSGCSGNQAVAVSMRELSLGVVRPREIFRVLWKECTVGIINGIALGILLGIVAFIWKGNVFLALVVGSALGLNTLVAVMLGGSLPLLMKRLRLDPALVSGPLLTTVTDMCGFFLTLSFATIALERLG